MARGKKWPNQKRIRCLKRINHLLPKIGFKLTFEQVADESDVPERTLIHWQQMDKKKRAQAEAEKTETGLERVYPPAGTPRNEVRTIDHPEPVAPAPPPEPESVFLNTEGAQFSCSRCSSHSHLYQDADQLWFCSICEVHLPWDPPGDMELKCYPSPYGRSNHWMS